MIHVRFFCTLHIESTVLMTIQSIFLIQSLLVPGETTENQGLAEMENNKCYIPSPCIINLVTPSRLPVAGVICVTRPPKRCNKNHAINFSFSLSRASRDFREQTRPVSALMDGFLNVAQTYLELKQELRITKQLQLAKCPRLVSSSCSKKHAVKEKWENTLLSKLCDVFSG